RADRSAPLGTARRRDPAARAAAAGIFPPGADLARHPVRRDLAGGGSAGLRGSRPRSAGALAVSGVRAIGDRLWCAAAPERDLRRAAGRRLCDLAAAL